MSFKIEGIIDVVVTDAYIADARWQPLDNELNNSGLPVQAWGDICLMVADKDGNNDIWRGELSNRNGNGTRAHQEQTDITLEKIVNLGFNVPTFQALMEQCDDNMGIPNMIGMELSVTTEKRTFQKRDGSQGEAIQIKYINKRGEGGPRRMSKADFMAKFATPAPSAQAPVQQAAPTAAPNYPPQGAPAPQPPPQYQQGYQQSAPAPQGYPQNAAPQAAPNNHNGVPGAPGSQNCPY